MTIWGLFAISSTFGILNFGHWDLFDIWDLKFDESVKSPKINLLSFRRKPESSKFNMFWMPDQACPQLDWGSGMTIRGLFTNPSNLEFKQFHSAKESTNKLIRVL
jgi:hypothetical protein